MKSTNVLFFVSILLFSCAMMISTAYAVGVFQKTEKIFNKTYDAWVEDWWKWNVALPGNETIGYHNLIDNGCLINKEGPVVMLIDPAAGGTQNQKCEISSNQGILISAWGAVCSGASRGNENKSFEELLECAKGFNQGTVTVNVLVDNKPIAEVKAVDGKTISLINADEVATKGFNITFPKNSSFVPDTPDTHLSATDGWYVFLKPLPVGEHTVHYTNAVTGPNANNADITYSLTVK
ncbi:MAG TPA: hypothetical protein VFB48_04310 [Nitrososphaeraceae archaeon]|nr:hypothetical protein [Nitrososphaeraceae archaeon]